MGETKTYQCKRKKCTSCPYEYCIDGENYDNAMEMVAAAKQKRDIEMINNPSMAYKIWYENNKKHVAEYHRDYYQQNRERILEANKQYRETHKEQIHEEQKNYRNAHKRQIREKSAKWYQENRERKNEQAKAYYWRKKCGISQCQDRDAD